MRFCYSVSIILFVVGVVGSSVVVHMDQGVRKAPTRQRGLADASFKYQNSIRFLESVNVSDVVSADDFDKSNIVVGDRRNLSDAGVPENTTATPEIRLPPARRHLQTRRSLQHRQQLHEFVNDSLHEFADFLSKRDLLDDPAIPGDLVNTTVAASTNLTPSTDKKCETSACKVVDLVLRFLNHAEV